MKVSRGIDVLQSRLMAVSGNITAGALREWIVGPQPCRDVRPGLTLEKAEEEADDSGGPGDGGIHMGHEPLAKVRFAGFVELKRLQQIETDLRMPADNVHGWRAAARAWRA